jgi:hypothetical protein
MGDIGKYGSGDPSLPDGSQHYARRPKGGPSVLAPAHQTPAPLDRCNRSGTDAGNAALLLPSGPARRGATPRTLSANSHTHPTGSKPP